MRDPVAPVVRWARHHGIPDSEKRGESPERYKRRHDNPLWRVLERALAHP